MPDTRTDTDALARGTRWAIVTGLWLMILIIFSVPNRESPAGLSDLDPIALAKVAARLISMAVLSLAIVRTWSGGLRQRLAAWTLVPLCLYAVFAIASTVWSPLKAVTLGQAAGLLVMVLLAALIATSIRDERDTEWLLLHLTVAMLFICVILLGAHAISSDLSGFNRDPSDPDGSLGMLHPTASGATASLGLVTLVGTWLLWGWRWASRLLVPGSTIFLLAMLLAASRTAAAMAIVLLVAMFLTLVPRSWFGVVALSTCTALALYLAVDPVLDGLDVLLATGLDYASKGESVQTMSTLTGRTELWEKIWAEFMASPLIGHGYFVTSSTGALDVWGGPANRTAHNVLLQALVTTGVVGTALFLWGLWRPVRLLQYAIGAASHVQRAAAFTVLIGLWFAGWGLLSSTFLGPIRPESVVFFVTLGLGTGNLASWAADRRDRVSDGGTA